MPMFQFQKYSKSGAQQNFLKSLHQEEFYFKIKFDKKFLNAKSHITKKTIKFITDRTIYVY